MTPLTPPADVKLHWGHSSVRSSWAPQSTPGPSQTSCRCETHLCSETQTDHQAVDRLLCYMLWKKKKLTGNSLLPKAVPQQGIYILSVPAFKRFYSSGHGSVSSKCKEMQQKSESFKKDTPVTATSVSARPPVLAERVRSTAASPCASAACSNPETAGHCGETDLKHTSDSIYATTASFMSSFPHTTKKLKLS